MDVIKWSSALTVDDKTIDGQHKQLLSQINKIYERFMNNAEDATIEETLKFLEKYINNHLTYEEEYMQKHNYPGFVEHKRIHEEFLQKYKEFKEEFAEKKSYSNLAIKVEKFLGGWWVNHIGIVDHQYAEYIKEHEKQ